MRAFRGWPLLVLVVVLGLLGPPASASASDAGLRTAVRKDVAAEKRLNAASKRLRSPASKSFSAYVRFLRRLANYENRVSRTVLGVRRRYKAQQPQTADATRGRALLLLGHRDVAGAAHTSAAVLHRGIGQMSHARTEGAYRRAYRRMTRGLQHENPRFRRGDSRIARGRKLIANAPAPSAPEPAPTTPGTPTPTAPAPAPTPSAPPSLLPPLPLLPSLLGS